jgi:hypothetical protein
MDGKTRVLSLEQHDELMSIIKTRFINNMSRHQRLSWDVVQSKLEANKERLWSLYEMERTGGEPDIVLMDNNMSELVFIDCSEQTPKGRRSVCYDREAMIARKENKPKNNAIEMAKDMGIELLTEAQYRELQKFGKFDSKTSSWVKTPDSIRELGGAIFCDFRYNTVFVYHNSAESYYASRGFRGLLKL